MASALKSPEKIREQLGRVIESDRFRNAPRQSQLLEFLVGKVLAGEANHIKAYTIATEVFDRKSDFSSSIDPIVRIQMGRLRGSLERYYDEEGRHDPIRIEFKKGSYHPIIQQVLATKKVKGSVESQSTALSAKRDLRIVIFPFEHSVSSLDYMVDRLRESLADGFIAFSYLKVISHLSAGKIYDEQLSLRELKDKYEIDYVISGKVMENGNKLSVKAEVSETSSETTLWLKKVEVDLVEKELVGLVENLAGQILRILGGDLGVLSRHQWKSIYSDDPNLQSVKKLIFQYRQGLIDYGPSVLENYIPNMEKALKQESDFAEGWALLAQVYLDQSQFSIETKAYMLEKGTRCAMKANQLNPLAPETNLALSYVNLFGGNLDESIAYSRKVVIQNPNDTFHCGDAGFFLAVAGELEEGVKILQKLMTSNPYHPPYLHHALMLKALFDKDFIEAEKQASLFYSPDFYWSFIDQAATLGLVDRKEEAAAMFEKLIALLPDFENHPMAYLELFVMDPKLQALMLKGLHAAGLSEESISEVKSHVS